MGQGSGQPLAGCLRQLVRLQLVAERDAAARAAAEADLRLLQAQIHPHFVFNTLATLVYEDASRGMAQDSSVAALIIILAGLIPVILVSRSLDART